VLAVALFERDLKDVNKMLDDAIVAQQLLSSFVSTHKHGSVSMKEEGGEERKTYGRPSTSMNSANSSKAE
jgi:hypothetical protein